MKKPFVILVVSAAAVLLIFYFYGFEKQVIAPAPTPLETAEKGDLIRVFTPRIGEKISSPLVIEGEARGNWYFEANFPVVLTNWDGLIIAEHYTQAQGEWMTADYVPFKATLEFENPVFPGADENHFSRRGYLILKKDNPSGLPEYDDALEFPVFFK